MPTDPEIPQSSQDEFFAAIEAGEVAIVRRYLERDPALANAINSRPLPSFPTFQEEHPERVGSGLGGRPAKAERRNSETALHVAVRLNRLEVSRLLVAHGAAVNALTQSSKTDELSSIQLSYAWSIPGASTLNPSFRHCCVTPPMSMLAAGIMKTLL